MVGEMNDKLKDLEGSVCTLRYYPSICLEGLRKTAKNLRQNT
jgi:hypothetical protein